MEENINLSEENISDKLALGKKAYSRVGLSVGLFYLVWNILVIITSLIIFSIVKVKATYTIAILLSLGFELVSLILYVFMLSPLEVTAIPKKKLKFGTFFKCVMVMYFFSIAGSIAGNFINIVLRLLGPGASVSNVMTYVTKNYPLMFVYAAILAPVIEEMIFRKLLIDRIYKYGTKVAIITSGILFGLIHGNIEQFGYAFLIGVFFAFVYVKTGNIKYTIALHMIMNSVSLILAFMMTKVDVFSSVLSGNPENITVGVRTLLHDPVQLLCFFVIIAITCAEYGFAIAGLVMFIIRIRKMVLPDKGQPQITMKLAHVNFGMIFMYIVILGFFVYSFFKP